MALLDHLGITVDDLERGRAQFHPVLTALGYVSGGEDDHSISWNSGEYDAGIGSYDPATIFCATVRGFEPEKAGRPVDI